MYQQHPNNVILLFAEVLSKGTKVRSNDSHIDKIVQKMVGAEDIGINKIPFMIAFQFNKNHRMSKCGEPDMPKCTLGCTGSLISARWAVSATHCLGSKKSINIKNCDLPGIQCQENEHLDFVIFPKEVKSYIYVNVQDFTKNQGNHQKYEIKRIIRPHKAYPSAGYGVGNR